MQCRTEPRCLFKTGTYRTSGYFRGLQFLRISRFSRSFAKIKSANARLLQEKMAESTEIAKLKFANNIFAAIREI